MIKVWVLVLQITAGSPTSIVIDNISTLAECQRIGVIIKSEYLRPSNGQCIEVWKVKP